MEVQITDITKEQIEKIFTESLTKATNDGILIGFEECIKSVMKFYDEVYKEKQRNYITKNEMNSLLNNYFEFIKNSELFKK